MIKLCMSGSNAAQKKKRIHPNASCPVPIVWPFPSPWLPLFLRRTSRSQRYAKSAWQLRVPSQNRARQHICVCKQPVLRRDDVNGSLWSEGGKVGPMCWLCERSTAMSLLSRINWSGIKLEKGQMGERAIRDLCGILIGRWLVFLFWRFSMGWRSTYMTPT